MVNNALNILHATSGKQPVLGPSKGESRGRIFFKINKPVGKKKITIEQIVPAQATDQKNSIFWYFSGRKIIY